MRKLFSIALAIFLMAGHMSFTLGTHLCQGNKVETKFIIAEQQLGCDMENSDKTCSLNKPEEANDSQINPAPCCQNDLNSFMVTDEFVPYQPVEISIVSMPFSLLTSLQKISQSVKMLQLTFYHDTPPPPLLGTQAILQIFRI
ncbi:MAG TPA: hypothetical protein VJ946_00810 [Bacteroidales bacterium]|nr:hypothetical protein [Bacteroidales bacterium]